ncbi:MAG: replicative DNA helicase [Sphingomonadales bacterium]|nr:replicative DNA helicase [Sphingomonadales bacterium]
MAEILRIDGSSDVPQPPSLPANVEAEAALLGALMVDNRLVEDVQIRLKAHHFFEPLHGRIYDAILRLSDKNMIANPVTLRPMFEGDEAMKEVGGPAYLAQLTGSGAAVIGARDFAAQIYDLALLRALVGVGRDMVEGALDTSEEVAPLAQIERAETELYRVAEEGGSEGKAKSFGEAAIESIKNIETALNSGGHLSGITTGLEGINAKIGGLHRSDLTILAGRPGMGKSSLATNIAFAAAQRYSLSGLPLYIDDTPGLTIAALRTRARRLKRQKGVGMIIVDYLQLLQGSGRSSNDNRVQEISEISRGLKQLAKELHVPVLALSQLSRAVEQREDKRPQLSDLRESGSIEQDADIVLFIYREDYYLTARQPADDHPDAQQWREEMERVYGQAELIVAKQRHGATGKVRMRFDSRVTKFSDAADESYLPEMRG